MEEIKSPVAPLVAQSPLPALMMMLQILLHQRNVTEHRCNEHTKNISKLHEEILQLKSENSRLQDVIAEWEKKSLSLEEKIKLQALEIEVQTIKKLENETIQSNISNIEESNGEFGNIKENERKFKQLTEVQTIEKLEEENIQSNVSNIVENTGEFENITENQLTYYENDTKPAEETLKIFFETFLKKETPECNKDRALLLAVRSNDLAATAALVAAGTNVDAEDASSWHRTPLHWAANQNHLAVAQILIQGGADIESRETGIYSLYTPLHEAAKHNHLTMCNLLLDSGAKLNSRDGSGSTPLHTAARQGHLEMVKLLVKRGATVNEKDEYGSTPRDRAKRFHHREVAAWLAEAEKSAPTANYSNYI